MFSFAHNYSAQPILSTDFCVGAAQVWQTFLDFAPGIPFDDNTPASSSPFDQALFVRDKRCLSNCQKLLLDQFGVN